MWRYLILMSFLAPPFPVRGEGEPMEKECKIEKIIPLVNWQHSTFNFTAIYNLDPDICYGKIRWRFVMKNCDAIEEGPITRTCIGVKDDVCQISVKGRYKVQMDGEDLSECFKVPGLFVVPTVVLTLRDTHVRLNIKPDERVKSWNFTAYEAFAEPNETNPKCSIKRLPPYLRPLFEKAYVGENSEVNIPYSFSHNKCYCFRIRPNGYDSKIRFPSDNVIRSNCRPINTRSKSPKVIQGNQPAIISAAVVIVILLIAVMVCLVVRKLRLSRMMPALPEEGRPQPGLPRDVLVIYAKDEESHFKRVDKLIKELQRSRKSQIYDIHTYIGQEKLADPNEWLRKRLREDRILLLLSLSLKQHMEVVFSAKEMIGTNPALVYCLRSLIGLNDYSKVFVARLSSEISGEESGDYTEILTRARRYTLPEHLEELKKNLQLI